MGFLRRFIGENVEPFPSLDNVRVVSRSERLARQQAEREALKQAAAELARQSDTLKESFTPHTDKADPEQFVAGEPYFPSTQDEFVADLEAADAADTSEVETPPEITFSVAEKLVVATNALLSNQETGLALLRTLLFTHSNLGEVLKDVTIRDEIFHAKLPDGVDLSTLGDDEVIIFKPYTTYDPDHLITYTGVYATFPEGWSAAKLGVAANGVVDIAAIRPLVGSAEPASLPSSNVETPAPAEPSQELSEVIRTILEEPYDANLPFAFNFSEQEPAKILPPDQRKEPSMRYPLAEQGIVSDFDFVKGRSKDLKKPLPKLQPAPEKDSTVPIHAPEVKSPLIGFGDLDIPQKQPPTQEFAQIFQPTALQEKQNGIERPYNEESGSVTHIEDEASMTAIGILRQAANLLRTGNDDDFTKAIGMIRTAGYENTNNQVSTQNNLDVLEKAMSRASYPPTWIKRELQLGANELLVYSPSAPGQLTNPQLYRGLDTGWSVIELKPNGTGFNIVSKRKAVA